MMVFTSWIVISLDMMQLRTKDKVPGYWSRSLLNWNEDLFLPAFFPVMPLSFTGQQIFVAVFEHVLVSGR